jgi:hypothetical protein
MTEETNVADTADTAEAESVVNESAAAEVKAKELQAEAGELVSVEVQKFNFRAVKETKVIKDEETGEDKKVTVETKRDPLYLALPAPNAAGILAIVEAGGKELELLLEVVKSVPTQQARAMISEDGKLTLDNFPVEKCDWSAIANMPKATRSGGGIPKEVWEAFCDDYIAVMPEATGKSVDKVKAAAKILQNKFAAIKTQHEILEFMQGQIAIYAESSEKAEEFIDCIEFLLEKIDSLLNVTAEDLLANL